jgi:hypothetical protein
MPTDDYEMPRMHCSGNAYPDAYTRGVPPRYLHFGKQVLTGGNEMTDKLQGGVGEAAAALCASSTRR